MSRHVYVYWSIDQIDSVLIFFTCVCVGVGDKSNGDNKCCDPICPLSSVHVRISIALCRGRFCVNWFEVRDFVDIAETVNHHCINFLFLKAKE